MRLTVSTSCVRGFDTLTDLVTAFLEHGLDRIELSHCPPLRPGELEELQGSGATLSVHNYFPPTSPPFLLNLASFDETCLTSSMAMARGAIASTARFGAGFYAVHAGFGADVLPESLGRKLRWGAMHTPDAVRERMIETLRTLCDEAAEVGVSIAIENHVVAAHNLVDGENRLLPFAYPGELGSLIRDCDRMNLGVLLDVGHLNVSAATLGFDRTTSIDEVAPHVMALHISDNDGLADRNWPVEAGSWVIDTLNRADFVALPRILEVNADSVAHLAHWAQELENRLEWPN